MSDVFISYSRKDKAFVQQLHAALAAEGRDTWVDWEDIEYTEDWWAGIQAGIEEADTFVFIISPDSVASEVCHQEINHAAAHNKRLVPIVYREAPTDQVPDKLQPLNWLFFRQSDDFDRVFKDLMRVMDTDEGPVWRASVESPHSGERQGFARLEALFAFLRQKTEDCTGGEELPHESAR